MRPLAVIGNVNVDLIVGPVAPWPAAGTETVVNHDELRVGGQAGNTGLAWMALGVDFEIAANVGDDQFGRWLREAFGRRAEKWPVRPEGTTLSVGMTHPDGERTFFTTRGHLPRFGLGDVFSVLDGRALSGGYALLCGSFLTDDLTRHYDAFFDWADSNGIAFPGNATCCIPTSCTTERPARKMASVIEFSISTRRSCSGRSRGGGYPSRRNR